MDNITFIKEGFAGQKSLILPNNLISRIKLKPLSGMLFLTDIGYFPNAKYHYRERYKGCKEYILIYCTEGKGWVDIFNKRYPVLPNQYFIIPKNIPHKYGADEKNPWSIYWMHFDGNIGPDLYERYNSTPGVVTVSVPYTDERVVLFNRIIDVLNSGLNEEKIQYSGLLGLNFLSSLIYSNLNISVERGSNDDLVDQIINYLNKNIYSTITTTDIVEKFNYSPSYLFSLFKKKTGHSIIHFFNLLKIQKACEYLNFSDLTVKEVGFKMGFKDPLYFSRLFKKYMGMAPSEYKKELIG